MSILPTALQITAGANNVNTAQAHMLPRVQHILTRAEFDAAVIAQRGFISGQGLNGWINGERIRIIGEIGERIWTVGGSAAASHARVVEFHNGAQITLDGDINTVTRTTGAPTANGANAGDKAVDPVAGLLYAWTSTWGAGTQIMPPVSGGGGGGGYPPTSIPFSTVIPLDGQKYMAQHQIAGPLNFTLGATALAGSCYLRLIGDGTTTPTFTGFSERGNSSSFNPQAGAVNTVFAEWDGVTACYTVAQFLNVVPVDPVPAAPTGLTVGTIGANTIQVSWTQPGTGGTVTGTHREYREVGATEWIRATTVGGATSATFTGLTASKNYELRVLAYNATGEAASSIVTASTSAPSGLQVVDFASVSQVSKVGDAESGYVLTVTTASTNSSRAANASRSLAASTDGYVRAAVVQGSSAGPVALIMRAGAFTAVSFDAADATYALNGNVGSNWQCRAAGANLTLNGTAVACAIGDVPRIRRAGTSLFFEVSRDGGDTYTTLHTLTVAATEVLWPIIHMRILNHAMGPVLGSGLTPA